MPFHTVGGHVIQKNSITQVRLENRFWGEVTKAKRGLMSNL